MTVDPISERAVPGSAARDGVRITSPAPREVWRAALAADPDAVATQTPEWLDCLSATRGYVDASRLYELPDGRRLVLPLAARRWTGVALTEESWPYGWGYGGVLVQGGGLTEVDCRLVLADLARRPVIRSAVVPMPLTAGPWSAAAPPGVQRVPYTSRVIDLDGGFDTVWSKRFRRQARNSVRKAQRFALDVRREHGGSGNVRRDGGGGNARRDGGNGDVRGVQMFAELYRQSVDRWAIQRGQPLRVARLLAARRDRPGQVAAVAAALGERCVVWSATRNGEPVAVNVLLQFGQHSLGWLSAMNTVLARQTLATYLLQSLVIEDACSAGVRHFHMGESDAGSGAEHYKGYFGAAPVEYEALRFERLPLTRAEQQLRSAFAKVSALRLRRAQGTGTS